MNIRTKLRRAAALIVIPLAIAACDDDDTVTTPEPLNIVETAQEAGSFTTLITALEATGLRATLEGSGSFTVFAPTDDAFAALPAGTLDALLADPDALAEILLYHVVDGELGSEEVLAETFIQTLNGQSVRIDGAGTVDDAGIATVDIGATNGIIHVIDAVMLPSTDDVVDIAIGNASFSTLVTALSAADLVGALRAEGPFTVFAPTNEAFAAIPEETLNALLADTEALIEVLTYHVVPGRVLSPDVVELTEAQTLNGASFDITLEGSSVRVDEANVLITDIQGTNGVVHVIDRVILPPGLSLN